MFKELFNAKVAAPIVLAAALTGCATLPGEGMDPGQAGDYARQTGINPVPYDACGQLNRATRRGTGALGAVGGGVLGSQLGEGRGRTANTVLGAIAGAYAEQYLRRPEIDRLYQDCLAQQAANNALGGSIRGSNTRFAPGGIFGADRSPAYSRRYPVGPDRAPPPEYSRSAPPPAILKAWQECQPQGCFNYYLVDRRDARDVQSAYARQGMQIVECGARTCTLGAPANERR